MSEIQWHHPLLTSDQGPQCEVWGEQEMFCTWLVKQPTEEFISDDPAAQRVVEHFEYHVGLDYFQQLYHPTLLGDEASDFVFIEDQNNIEQRSKDLNMTSVRLMDVPKDLHMSWNPLNKVLSKDIPSWRNMSLFAHFFSEAVPVLLHHNSHRHGYKTRRETGWDRTWFFPHLRRFVDAYLQPLEKLPVLGEAVVGQEKVMYRPLPSELLRRRPRRFDPDKATEGLPELTFEEPCLEAPNSEKWFNQVFRDGQGPV